MIEFTENIAKSFELYIYGKKFHQIGALLLDKVFKITIKINLCFFLFLKFKGNKKYDNFLPRSDFY